MTTLQQSIRRLLRVPTVPLVGEEELLRRFVRSRDQAAFELLVHRYGPMVLGLCRKLIHHLHDAEDAFQATFLTLAKQAPSIKKGQSLGSWLFKVTLRICQRQRTRSARWANSIDPSKEPLSRESVEEVAQQREEVLLIAAEINRLSETLRAAVLLCYIQGRSAVEAARELGCPANTISMRLKRAREQLHQRLAQRGLTLGTSLAVTLGASTASAHIAPIQALELAQTALALTAGHALNSLVTPSISFLMKGALVTMLWKPAKVGLLILLAASIVSVPVWNNSGALQAQPPVRGYILGEVNEHSISRLGFHPQHSVEEPPKDTMYPQDESLPDEVKKWIAAQKKQEEAIRQEAEKRIRDLQAQLYKKLKGAQDSYTKSGDLDRAVAIRDQVRRLEVGFMDAKPDPGALSGYRTQIGKSFIFKVQGRINGSTIWGGSDGIYTDDSPLAVAAVHAGLVRPGQVSLVKVTILDGLQIYPGSSRNGITSSDFGNYPGSYQLSRPSLAEPVTESKVDVDTLINR